MGIHRGHNAHPFEWLAEKAILLISLSAILMIFLIFIFIGREALPIFLSQMNSASKQEIIPASQIDSIPPEKLMQYLELTPEEFKKMDKEALLGIMEIREEGAKEAKESPDASINTTK